MSYPNGSHGERLSHDRPLRGAYVSIPRSDWVRLSPSPSWAILRDHLFLGPSTDWRISVPRIGADRTMTSFSDFHIFLSMDRSNRMDPRRFERFQQTSSHGRPDPDRIGTVLVPIRESGLFGTLA
jgi:hypothetical protein